MKIVDHSGKELKNGDVMVFPNGTRMLITVTKKKNWFRRLLMKIGFKPFIGYKVEEIKQ